MAVIGDGKSMLRLVDIRCILLFYCVFISCFSSFAYCSNDDRKSAPQAYYVPKPDAIPLPAILDKPLKTVKEPTLIPILPKYYASTRYGIDVSRYQKEINWKEVSKDPNVTFVYLKATESTGLVDRTYYNNLHGARQVGLPVGVYHFFSPNAPAQQQLVNFMRAVDPKTQDLIPIVDVEVTPRRKSQLAAFLSRLRAFVDGVERYFGCKPMIYTSQYFYNTYLRGKFLDCPFMLAKYSEELPMVVDDIDVLVWQFTASGTIRGIEGDVDRSCMMNHYTVDDIRYVRGNKK